MLNKLNKQNGAVSIFIVIFTAILITTITVSFVQLMVRDQQQATTSDLSQSAYDSAMAGVEDAKRALILQDLCNKNHASVSVPACNLARTAISSGECQSVSNALGIIPSNGEILIKQDESDIKLDQAYTCVKIASNTPDYIGSLNKGTSQLITLKGSGAFNTIELNWFTKVDNAGSNTVELANMDRLPRTAKWDDNTPPVMRTQFISPGSSFDLSEFDTSKSNTLFLYPAAAGSITKSFSIDDVRRLGNTEPEAIQCLNNFNTSIYSCKVKIELPNEVNDTQTAYLRLSTLYNKATYQVKLSKSGSSVDFAGVQPEIDSTGRANDLFRRVKSRVSLDASNLNISAIEVNEKLCKDFTITDKEADYKTGLGCED